MALDKIPTTEPSEEVVEDGSTPETGLDIGNYGPDRAQAEADEIVSNLPGSLDKFSPEEQELFIKLVGPQVEKVVNVDRNNSESVPDIIPENTVKDVNLYKKIRDPKNFSKLPIDKQEALKNAEKNAVLEVKEQTKKALYVASGTNGLSNPDSPVTTPGQSGWGSTSSPDAGL